MMHGTIPPLPQYAFMAWCSVKERHRDNFTFTIYTALDENSCFALFMKGASSFRKISYSP
jgi:hypothetical protein